MSRSRRKRKPGKCICGRGYVPYAGHVQYRREIAADCPVIQPVHEINEQFRRFKERRDDLAAGDISAEMFEPPIDYYREMAEDAYAVRGLFRHPDDCIDESSMRLGS